MGSILHRRRNKRRILLACVLASFGVLVWAVLRTQESTYRKGVHMTGQSVYLEVTPTVMKDADGVLDGIKRLSLETDLTTLIVKGLERARTAAAERTEYPELHEALSVMTPQSITLEVGSPEIDSELVLTADVSASGPTREGAEPDFPEGVLFMGVVGIRSAPWPRKEGFTPHPEVLLGQSSIAWHARTRGADILAHSLAHVLAEHAASQLRDDAVANGLKASLEPLP